MLELAENLFLLWMGGAIHGAALEYFNEDKADDISLWEMIFFIVIWPYSIVYLGIKGDK